MHASHASRIFIHPSIHPASQPASSPQPTRRKSARARNVFGFIFSGTHKPSPHGSNNTAFFCGGAPGPVCSGRPVGDHIENVCSIKSIACAYPHGCPRKSRPQRPYNSQCRINASAFAGAYRASTHARPPSIRNIQPIRPGRPPSFVPSVTHKRAHKCTHTQTHTNIRSPSTLHLCDSLLMSSHILFVLCMCVCWCGQLFLCVLMLIAYVAPSALGIQQSRLSSLTRTRTRIHRLENAFVFVGPPSPGPTPRTPLRRRMDGRIDDIR